MVPRNVISGFSSIGTWPYNSEIFSKADFVPSIVTDRDPYSASLMNTAEHLSEANDRNAQESPSAYSLQNRSNDWKEGYSNSCHQKDNSSCNYVPFQEILLIPKAAPRNISLTRSRGKTRIYTDIPVRDEVEKKSIEKKNN